MSVCILGAGGWGTALSAMLGLHGRGSVLWARRPELAGELLRERENRAYLPGVRLPDTVQVTSDLEQATAGHDWALLTVPSVGIPELLEALPRRLGVVLCATSLTLTASLLFFGMLDGPRALVSAAAVVPAIGGMWLGQQIRSRLSVEQFRLAVFWALLLTGLYTVATRLL